MDFTVPAFLITLIGAESPVLSQAGMNAAPFWGVMGEVLNQTEYLHMDGLPAMVHLFGEGHETVRRATVPGQAYLLLLLPGSLGSTVRRRAKSSRQEDEPSKDGPVWS